MLLAHLFVFEIITPLCLICNNLVIFELKQNIQNILDEEPVSIRLFAFTLLYLVCKLVWYLLWTPSIEGNDPLAQPITTSKTTALNMLLNRVVGVFFCVLLLLSLICRTTSKIRKLSSNNSTAQSFYPHGHEKTNRIAICLTGQLRSSNLSWTSGHLVQNAAFRMFGRGDPPTPAATIVEWLFKPLAKLHGVDVFMYLTAHPDQNNSAWDGRPETYEAAVGDMRACQIFSDNEVFRNTGNRFFCIIEPEVQLMDYFAARLPQWRTYGKPLNHNEQALQQLYSLYRANLAAKQHAVIAEVQYSHKIRLRPDTAVVKPFPPLTALKFIGGSNRGCNTTIFFANKVIYRNGNEDWFNIGLAADMDILLDRYIEFISTPFIHNSRKDWWDLENHLLGVVELRHRICLDWYFDIWMVVIRKENHNYNTWEPRKNDFQWVELSTSSNNGTK